MEVWYTLNEEERKFWCEFLGAYENITLLIAFLREFVSNFPVNANLCS